MGRNSNYVRVASRPAIGEISSYSSSHKDHIERKSLSTPKILHSRYPSTLQRPKISPSIPLSDYRHSKMSPAARSRSLKRAQEEDDKLPFKKIKLVEVTGLEDDPVLGDITERTASTYTSSEIGKYRRRKKVAKPAQMIRVKKAMATKVRGDWGGMPTPAQQGLRNITGATCYRLSLMQALLHQPHFVHFIQDYHRPEDCCQDTGEECVACCLRLLTLEYWRDSQDSAGLSKILQEMDVLFKGHGWFSDVASGHADPEDQVSWIFGVLEFQLPSTTFACLKAIMQPVLTTAVCCGRCGYESRTSGHIDQILPLPIAPTIRDGDVQMYLHKYMVETLDDYRCDKCKDKTGTKYRKQLLSYAPDILTVQLKRTDEFGRKLNHAVAIDRFLDFTKYRDAGNQENLRYELSAVIKHKGNSAFGHYICSAKASDGHWYGFDDTRKSKISLDAAASSSGGFTPYILYFQRKED